MSDSKIKIMVATHKAYEFPKDAGYMPVHVGKALNSRDLGFVGDDSGDNISGLNKSFCELTGLYWLWKNQTAEYIGLAHYRRYFKSLSDGSVTLKNKRIASSKDLLGLMSSCGVLLTKRRCYVIDTIRSHYRHAHYESDLNELEKVVSELYPDYLPALNKVLDGRCVALYNMFVMQKNHFDEYATWLFAILFELEKRVPYKEYGAYQGRVFGFLAERLLNVWVEKHKDRLKVCYLSVVNIEGENLFLKVVGLLKRKFLGKKLD